MLNLHPANPPPHDFAGLRRGLELVWPRPTGHTFAEIVAAWCVAQTICHASRPPR